MNSGIKRLWAGQEHSEWLATVWLRDGRAKSKLQAASGKQEATLTHLFYDFESCQDKKQRKKVTESFTFENVHVPISVSVGDTFEREPTYICDTEPKELIRKFLEELER